MQKRLCLAWRTDRPYAKRPHLSKPFSFQNSYWSLNIGCSETNEYYIELRRKSIKNRFLAFDITTYIENVEDKNGAFFPQTISVSHTPLRIWSVPESAILEKIPEMKDCGELSVVCVLHGDSDNSEVETKLPPLHISVGRLHSETGLESLSADLCKLLESDILPDVKLRCENRIFSAHRVVLAARSEVFAAMFRNKMVESETGIVDITDMESPVLDLFLKYLYSGKIPDLSEDIVPSLYRTSDKYAVHALKKACSEWMISGLTEENCLSFLTLADAHNDLPFKDQVTSFISDNNEVLRSEHWLKFSEEVPKLSNEIYHRCFEHIPKKKKYCRLVLANTTSHGRNFRQPATSTASSGFGQSATSAASSGFVPSATSTASSGFVPSATTTASSGFVPSATTTASSGFVPSATTTASSNFTLIASSYSP